MKKKERENLKGMKKGELEKKLASLREDNRALRFKTEGSKSKNVKEFGTTRREIARILTLIRQQE